MTARPVVLAVTLGLLAPAVLAGCASAPTPTTIELTMRYSRFSPAIVTVPRGVPITLVLRNEDPIDHEWIIGTADVHDRHRTGTEPVHDTRATEVTVPALSTRTTTVTFDRAGTLSFVCHIPGHEAYGMVGTWKVAH